MSIDSLSATALEQQFHQLRGETDVPPDASIVIPVNAQSDLERVMNPLADIAQYAGRHTVEVILVINNYPPDDPPQAINRFEQMGLCVIAVPELERTGRQVILAARMRGVRAASSDVMILFDADCRILNATALIDWYIEQLDGSAAAAYTYVKNYDMPDGWSVRAWMLTHRLTRWVKRVVLRLPALRGSNYAISRALLLRLYDEGYVVRDFNIGPAVKRFGGRLVYSGAKERTVLTSGRQLAGGWKRMVRYFVHRLRFHVQMLPVRSRRT